MLGYLRRTLPLILRSAVTRDGSLISVLDRRVSFNQIDLNLHMNQAAYAQVMELGRTDWVIRSGAWARWRGRGVNAVVADQRIIYRRELSLRATYRIDTRAIGLDGRLLHTQNFIVVGDRVHAQNDTKLIFIGADGVLGADAVAELCRGLIVAPLAIEGWRLSAQGR